MTMLQYASAMEMMQLIFAIVGLALALWGIWLAAEDAIDLTDCPPGDLRRLVAIGNIRGQLARTVINGVLVFVGMVSVLLPPPSELPGTEAELQQSFLVRMGLVIVTIILATDAAMERRQRMLFMDKTNGIVENHLTPNAKQKVEHLKGK